MLEIRSLRKVYDGHGRQVEALRRHHLHGRRRASSSASSARPAAARPRCCAASAACCAPTVGRGRAWRASRSTGPPDGLAIVFQEYGRSLFPWLRVRRQRRAAAEGQGPAAGPSGAGWSREALEAVGLADAAHRLPVAALRRHAAAGRDRPGAGVPAAGAADGRAVRRGRRADPGRPGGPGPLGLAAVRRHAAVRHPRHRRVGLPGPAGHRAVVLADHRRRGPARSTCRPSATSSPPGPTPASSSCAATSTRGSSRRSGTRCPTP